MYLDTSIIIKLLVREADSAFFDEHLAGKALSSSELAWTEVFSALQFKERNRQISAKDRAEAWKSFSGWVESEQIKLHPLTSVVLKKANNVLGKCHPTVPLRALDAIHTAACDLSQDFPLCTTDRRMRDAAGVLGIPVFPANEPS
jgi:predicted nucleic acid-binding protein